MDHKTEKMFCPTCLTKIDGAMNAEGGDVPPEDGDVSICIYCTEVLEYKNNGLIKCDVDQLDSAQQALILVIQESIKGLRILN